MTVRDFDDVLYGEDWYATASRDATSLYIVLFTNPLLHISGLYKIGDQALKGFAKFESVEQLQAAKDEIQELGKAMFGEESWVWVRGAAKRIRQKSKQTAKGCLRKLRECEDPELAAVWFERYGAEPWFARYVNSRDIWNLEEDEISGGSTEPGGGSSFSLVNGNSWNLPEVPGQGQGQGLSLEEQEGWSRARADLQNSVQELSFDHWLSRLAPVGIENEGCFVLGAPRSALSWVDQRYRPMIGQAIRRHIPRVKELKIVEVERRAAA